MNTNFLVQGATKEAVFKEVEAYIGDKVRINSMDQTRPWGGFMVIEESDAQQFIDNFFTDATQEVLTIAGKLTPKILLVEPGKKLSWQYHNRRAEIWTLISGTAAIIKSDDDAEKDFTVLELGRTVNLKQGERHRLIGLDSWGIVAEIWQHTDKDNPSDEDDIVRVQDDFGR